MLFDVRLLHLTINITSNSSITYVAQLPVISFRYYLALFMYLNSHNGHCYLESHLDSETSNILMYLCLNHQDRPMEPSNAIEHLVYGADNWIPYGLGVHDTQDQ